MNARALVELQLELECKRVEADNTIAPIPCDNPDEIPRCFVCQYGGEYTVYYGHHLPVALRDRLATFPAKRLFVDHDMVVQTLAADAPCASIWAGRTYEFPKTPGAELWPDAVRLEDRLHGDLLVRYEGGTVVGKRAVFGVIVGGEIVAACEASRENERAAEAWVRTVSAYRRHGYAKQVTAAWAHAMQQQGKVPFYSHSLENEASAAVARSLGLIHFLSAVAYS